MNLFQAETNWNLDDQGNKTYSLLVELNKNPKLEHFLDKQFTEMSMHLRSTLRRALFLANRGNGPVSALHSQKAALGNVAPSLKLEPVFNVGKFEKNIVVSPYPDCQFHDMTLTQKFFESAARWPDNVALVSY